MIKGVKYWSVKDHYYSQTNNPEEEEFRKKYKTKYLESCGPTSAVTIIAAMGHNVKISCPGDWEPQPESILTDFFNDPRNYPMQDKIRAATPSKDWLGNRIPQLYPYAVSQVFNVRCRLSWGDSFSEISSIVSRGMGVQVCLKKPGHYIALLAFDDEEKEFIFNDPWPGRKGLKNRGFNERMTKEEFLGNVQNFFLIYE